jgi:2-polyprenyl-3-methyl-5-hydroxy-6-metoxy-1,4-benzoquinol methylase
MSLRDKTVFSSNMLKKWLAGQSKACPYCRSQNTKTLARKQVLLELRECQECHLTYRYPKDDPSDNFEYYQQNYRQELVTDLPSEADLPLHIADNFAKVGRDLTEHLKLIHKFSTGKRLLDFGASWGYCTWQFQRAGYEAIGVEISRPRTEYGKKMLGVSMVNSADVLPDHSFDVIYSAHVLEHMPDPRVALQEFKRLLSPTGTFFIFVPNGAGEPARRLGVKWMTLINQRHVIAYTPRFFDYALAKEGLTGEFLCSPYDMPPRPYDASAYSLDGEELLAIGKPL